MRVVITCLEVMQILILKIFRCLGRLMFWQDLKIRFELKIGGVESVFIVLMSVDPQITLLTVANLRKQKVFYP